MIDGWVPPLPGASGGSSRAYLAPIAGLVAAMQISLSCMLGKPMQCRQLRCLFVKYVAVEI
jgi:hypothetical protein